MNTISKKYYIIGAAALVLVVVSVFLMMKQKAAPKQAQEKQSVFEEPAEDILPVDSSVIATIKGKTDAVITIKNVPEGTKSIEYQLIYSTKSGSSEGVIGQLTIEGSKAEKEITFGTCSSGVCRYHDIVGAVSGTFVFAGSYGERMLEQEFDL